MTAVPLLFFAAPSALTLVVGNFGAFRGWRVAAVRGAVLWGAYGMLTLELLSPFRAVTPAGLAGAWLLLDLACLALLLSRARQGHLRLPAVRLPRSWLSRGLLAGLAAALALTALTALLAPPQTWDALNYHLPRVAHWAQQAAVTPFATGIEIQNSMSPGAEFEALHAFVLGGGDRWVNLTAWVSFLVNLTAASALAAALGASPAGQLGAAAFAGTLPMAIVQASSASTDGVLGTWLLAAALEAVLAVRSERLPSISVVPGSLAAGLAVLTKPTSASYLVPLALFAAIALYKRWGGRVLLRAAPLALALAVGVNLGHWARNAGLYGAPFGGSGPFEQHVNRAFGWRPLASNLLRNAALSLGTPSPYVNKGLTLLVLQAHRWIGLDVNDPRLTSAGAFRVRFPTTHDDLSGAWLHGWLVLIVAAVWATRPGRLDRLLSGYALAVGASFVLFSFLFQWQIFGGRLLLPFFLLTAPAVGTFGGTLLSPRQIGAVGALLLLASTPWLVRNETRPLVPSAAGGLLTESRERLLFANGPSLRPVYSEAAFEIRRAGCGRVGLMLSGNDAEYPLWWLLGSPRRGLRIEWLVSGTPSARLRDASFRPCAVICHGCEGQATEWDLPLRLERAGYRLYLAIPGSRVPSGRTSTWKAGSGLRAALPPANHLCYLHRSAVRHRVCSRARTRGYNG